MVQNKIHSDLNYRGSGITYDILTEGGKTAYFLCRFLLGLTGIFFIFFFYFIFFIDGTLPSSRKKDGQSAVSVSALSANVIYFSLLFIKKYSTEVWLSCRFCPRPAWALQETSRIGQRYLY